MTTAALDPQVHHLSLTEAQTQRAQHLALKPAEPWESLKSQAWRDRKASLELWILLESRRAEREESKTPDLAPVQDQVPARARKARPKRKPHHHRSRFRRSGVLG